MESGKQVHIDVLESGIQPGCLGQPCNCLKYACVLTVCASARQGRQLHAPVLGNGLFEGDIVVVTCLCTRIRSQVGMPRLLRMLSMDSMTRTWCWCSTAGQAAAWHGFWKKDYLKVIKKDSHVGGLCTNAFGKRKCLK